MSCRAASMRRDSGKLLDPGPSPAATRRSRRRGGRAPGCPRAPARRTSCARAAGVSSTVSRLSASSPCRVEPGRLVLGPAAGQPADDRLVDRRLAAGQRRQECAEPGRSGRRVPSARPRGSAIASTSGRRRALAPPAASAFKNAASFCAAAAVAASASQWSPSTSPPRSAADQAVAGLVRRRLIGQARKAASRTWASGSRKQAGGETSRWPIERRAARPASHCAGRPPTDARARPRRPRRPRRSSIVEGAQAVQRPERVDRAGVQADRIDRAVARRARSAPGTTSVLPRSTSSRWACSRQN